MQGATLQRRCACWSRLNMLAFYWVMKLQEEHSEGAYILHAIRLLSQ